ncbi:DUF3703 domain-containing protein [Arenimonas sp.]|uniref:DUF3703 domain-containing protein n=1 Tax=Arenimonas sp. TaxID=1872635 RepID=UPI0039E7110E
MKPALLVAIRTELERGRSLRDSDRDGAFRHLERAHVLSQRHTFWHVRVHLSMLAHGLRHRDHREVFGQISRTLAASLFSRIWVPPGNTGGANVSAFQPMPLPSDLRALLD